MQHWIRCACNRISAERVETARRRLSKNTSIRRCRVPHFAMSLTESLCHHFKVFIEIERAVAIDVELRKHLIDLLIGEVHIESLHYSGKLLHLNGTRLVNVDRVESRPHVRLLLVGEASSGWPSRFSRWCSRRILLHPRRVVICRQCSPLISRCRWRRCNLGGQVEFGTNAQAMERLLQTFLVLHVDGGDQSVELLLRRLSRSSFQRFREGLHH